MYIIDENWIVRQQSSLWKEFEDSSCTAFDEQANQDFFDDHTQESHIAMIDQYVL